MTILAKARRSDPWMSDPWMPVIVLALSISTAVHAQLETVSSGEYFFDDAGTAEGAGIPLPANVLITPVVKDSPAVDVSGLAPGAHTLFVRYQDDSGAWGAPIALPFVVQDQYGAPTLAGAERFFGADPGTGSGTPLPAGTGAQPLLRFFEATDVTGLGAGSVTVGVRVQTMTGEWSQPVTLPFVARNGNEYGLNAIDRGEFFFDADPGLDLATPLPVAPFEPLAVASKGTEIFDVTALSQSPHTLSVRITDAFGLFSPNIVQSLNTRDLDMDGFIDLIDAFPLDQTEWVDTDGDGIGNNTDPDIDGDMMTNDVDLDDDGDGIPDADELNLGLDPINHVDGEFDVDRDGLTGLEEFGLGTDPTNPDTDGDGILDGFDPTPLIVGVLDTIPVPAGVDQGDRFGESVAVSGNRIAIGAPGDEGGGTVFVYRLEGGNPTLEETIRIPPEFVGAELGAAVDISGDTLVAGAPGMSPGAKFDNKGGTVSLLQAAVFERVSGNWQIKHPITGASGNGDDRFGSAVALTGSMLLIGAPGDAEGETTGSGSGAAYVFDQGSESITMLDKFKSPVPNPGALFGSAVAANNQNFAVGAPASTINQALSGSVSLYQLVGSNLSNLDNVVGSMASDGATFGTSISIVGDQIAVGAPGEVNATGAVYLYDIEATAVSERARIAAVDGASNDGFGTAIALNDGQLAIGSPGAGNGAVYEFDAATLEQTNRLDAPDGQTSFGSSVAAAGDRLAIGSPSSGNQGATALQRDVRVVFTSNFESD